MDAILAAKSDQAVELLKELDIDVWMIVVRESGACNDPSMPMVVGADVVWTSFFIFTKTGRKIALVGNFDAPIFERLGHFDEVKSYTKGVREDLLATLSSLHPKKIAVNYSLDYHMADGISHGLYMQLQKYLKGSLFEGMLVSSEKLLAELRAVKLDEEIERIATACDLTERLFGSLKRKIKAGMTGVEIYEFLKKKVISKGVEFSFPPAINIGTKSPLGHAMYSDDRLEPGEIFHIDFGVIYKGFCSDLQRLIYVLKKGETEPPEEVRKAFETVFGIIRETSRLAKPGTPGYRLDQTARRMLKEAGYPEYQHALGHQVGRFVHDGGTILGPRWERYGKSPYGKLGEGNVFTLELEIVLDGVGVIGLEEDVVVTAKRCKFLSKPQRRMICV
jgi:Xaa-Pro aminopeptidase